MYKLHQDMSNVTGLVTKWVKHKGARQRQRVLREPIIASTKSCSVWKQSLIFRCIWQEHSGWI